ncbi:hypothetical protein COCSADRAFT_157878 [Bipolaris sorokiniana ND90Pr]|uniref:Uncharacterized protein n=1 Tax=Cochliobolus sativus (strain ND90Pr / ATCC 201652) TaxID=665912 RepID=M2SJZ7_COCSN|nr:uncharacterized protein COCSADRAFT_157878 [Bipolaris sorokiniana ND90Pr]EMD67503.1 hypothetical protein COCSADRAFT_157878 [Bipolaris sorokiniana ND90Pr]
MRLSFLDLPPELRVKIYKYLSITTKHLVLDHALNQYGHASTIRLVVKFAPVEILRTCRLIYREVYPYVNWLVADCERPQVIVDISMMETFCEIICGTGALDMGKLFIMIMQEYCSATDLPIDQGRHRSRLNLLPSDRVVSTEYANKLRRFIERSHNYVNYVFDKRKRIPEIAVKIQADVTTPGRTLVFLVNLLCETERKRQNYRLYTKVEGELDATMKSKYSTLTDAWNYDLRYFGHEDAKGLDDAEWQADWEGNEVCENYVEAEAVLHTLIEKARRDPLCHLLWSIERLQDAVRAGGI